MGPFNSTIKPYTNGIKKGVALMGPRVLIEQGGDHRIVGHLQAAILEEGPSSTWGNYAGDMRISGNFVRIVACSELTDEEQILPNDLDLVVYALARMMPGPYSPMNGNVRVPLTRAYIEAAASTFLIKAGWDDELSSQTVARAVNRSQHTGSHDYPEIGTRGSDLHSYGIISPEIVDWILLRYETVREAIRGLHSCSMDVRKIFSDPPIEWIAKN